MLTQSTCLLAHTRELLQNRPRSVTLAQVAEGADVSIHWLSVVIRNPKPGEDTDPGVKRVQRVYEFLTNQPLLNSEVK